MDRTSSPSLLEVPDAEVDGGKDGGEDEHDEDHAEQLYHRIVYGKVGEA